MENQNRTSGGSTIARHTPIAIGTAYGAFPALTVGAECITQFGIRRARTSVTNAIKATTPAASMTKIEVDAIAG